MNIGLAIRQHTRSSPHRLTSSGCDSSPKLMGTSKGKMLSGSTFSLRARQQRDTTQRAVGKVEGARRRAPPLRAEDSPMDSPFAVVILHFQEVLALVQDSGGPAEEATTAERQQQQSIRLWLCGLGAGGFGLIEAGTFAICRRESG